MPTPLNPIDLTFSGIGATGKIDLTNCAPSSNAAYANLSATLAIYNESGCGLRLSFKQTSGGGYLPAGGWTNLVVPVAEVEVDYVVLYVLAQAQVSLVLPTYYAYNEPVPDIARLGNSPIGVGNNVLIAQATVQDGQAPGSQLIEATPLGGLSSSISIDNNGTGILGGGNVSIDGSGNISTNGQFAANGLMILHTGHQLTGGGGGTVSNATAGDAIGFFVPFGGVTLVNVPTSVTLTALQFNNENTPFGDTFQLFGFRLRWTATAAGSSTYVAKFVTVGN